MKHLSIFGAGLIASLWLTGCANFFPAKPMPNQARQAPMPAGVQPQKPSWWDDPGASGTPSIVIHLDEQRAYFYKGKQLIGESRISTGKKGFETPPGHYKVIQKDEKHVSNLYGDFVNAEGEVVKKNVDMSKDHAPEGTTFRGAKMPNFLRFTGGYGLHAGHLPGYRASHGCIRMPRPMAERFFHNAEIGTQVTVEQ